MPLPTCECIAGKPIQQQLGAIYCALLEILAGQGGGEITLSQISDLDASWIAPLQGVITNFGVDVISNPAIGGSSGYLTVNTDDAVTVVGFGAIQITASQISDASAVGVVVLTSLSTPVSQQFITIDAGPTVDTIPIGVTASQTPVTQVDTDRGIVTVLS